MALHFFPQHKSQTKTPKDNYVRYCHQMWGWQSLWQPHRTARLDPRTQHARCQLQHLK
jgi:hypothetical protein